MKKTIPIADDVRDVLSRSVISDNSVRLPEGKLDRELYARIDKVLKAAGGKWNRVAGMHLFAQYDPRELLGEAHIASGKIVNRQQTLQQFWTPPGVATKLVEHAGVEPRMRCLEPSAGTGAIALALRSALQDRERISRDPICIEVDEVLARQLIDQGFYDTFCMDFMAYQCSSPFDRIVMNPPFNGGQDIDHVTRAFEMLEHDGVLVAIMGRAFEFRTDRKHAAFRRLMNEHGDVLEHLPEGTFEDTRVETVVIRLSPS